MATAEEKVQCDVRIWSSDCEHQVAETGDNKYLCSVCGVLPKGDHEVRHEHYSNVSGDYHNLS